MKTEGSELARQSSWWGKLKGMVTPENKKKLSSGEAKFEFKDEKDKSTAPPKPPV